MTLKTKTEHPHIVKDNKIHNGRPIIKGTSIEVSLIVKLYKMGESVDEILTMYLHLLPASVFDALSYYHDHQKEIDQSIAMQDIQTMLKQYNLLFDIKGRIISKNK